MWWADGDIDYSRAALKYLINIFFLDASVSLVEALSVAKSYLIFVIYLVIDVKQVKFWSLSRDVSAGVRASHKSVLSPDK